MKASPPKASVVPWGCVHHTAERVAIVASGPSLSGVRLDLPPEVSVIAVNAGIKLLPKPPRFWFTLDTSAANRAIMQSPLRGTAYYAAVYDNYGTATAASPHLRHPPEPWVTFLKRVQGGNSDPKGSKCGLSEDPTHIHCGNSGYGALGLAYLMGATRIALLGIDAYGGYATGPGSPSGGLAHLPWLFKSAVPQLEQRSIEVRVGSKQSRVDCWERTTPQDALAWLAS